MTDHDHALPFELGNFIKDRHGRTLRVERLALAINRHDGMHEHTVTFKEVAPCIDHAWRHDFAADADRCTICGVSIPRHPRGVTTRPTGSGAEMPVEFEPEEGDWDYEEPE